LLHQKTFISLRSATVTKINFHTLVNRKTALLKKFIERSDFILKKSSTKFISGFSIKTLPKDIFAGIIIALISIPISMGYAQVAGLPPVYGLYGSVFPILIFGFLSSSPQFIFGVDAAPCALVGAYIAQIGIVSGSQEAENLIPLITFFVAIWLFIFYIFKAGKLVNYISTPVMGGFISGISTTIIFMQIPKILGGQSGTGEIFQLISVIFITIKNSFNLASFLLGSVALAILLISKKFIPKFPMAIFIMIAGALLTVFFHVDKYNVALLSSVKSGLPEWKLPVLENVSVTGILNTSLTVAIVIMAETLLASNNFANKNDYKIDDNREILVYSLANLSSAFVGCCPVNGSVSRTSMGEQYGGKSQIMSITASITMILILLFGTEFIKYLPVPVLTAIVISALLNAIEFDLAKRLYKSDKRELLIFLGAFFGVLIFGTVYGVAIGVVLSFVSVIIRTTNPKRSFLGVIPGKYGFHSLERNTYSTPIKQVVIYRFSSNLYFANINTFINDIENSIKEDTRAVIVDSGAICNIDITAADKIKALDKSLSNKNIKLYFASHIGSLNDRFRTLGLGYMVEKGYCRRTLPSALYAAGFKPPYVLEKNDFSDDISLLGGNQQRLEFEWAFGDKADEEMEKYTNRLLDKINPDEDSHKQLEDIVSAKGLWKDMSVLDQEELLEHLQLHIKELSQKLHITEEQAESAIETRRLKIALQIAESNPRAFNIMRKHNLKFEEKIKKTNPHIYKIIMKKRSEVIEEIKSVDSEKSELINKLYGID
jgi:high affinity sulfate transporter 1